MKEVNELGEGFSFGELALITDKPRMATVITKTARVHLGMLTKQDYQKLIGDNFKSKMDRATSLMR